MKQRQKYGTDDVHIIRMFIAFDEKCETVAVKKDDNGVPLFFMICPSETGGIMSFIHLLYYGTAMNHWQSARV